MSANSILAAVRVLVVALDVVWGLYLVLQPAEILVRNVTWAGALRAVPFGGNPELLGFAYLLGPLVLAASTLVGLARPLVGHYVAVFGHVASAGTWGLVAGSFGYAAHDADWLGIAGAAAALGFAGIHVLMALERR